MKIAPANPERRSTDLRDVRAVPRAVACFPAIFPSYFVFFLDFLSLEARSRKRVLDLAPTGPFPQFRAASPPRRVA